MYWWPFFVGLAAGILCIFFARRFSNIHFRNPNQNFISGASGVNQKVEKIIEGDFTLFLPERLA